MRGLYIILFGLLGLLTFGCVLPSETEDNAPEVITTTGQDCPGCAAEEETPPVEEPLVGGDKDEHGCIGSAGYMWCEVKQKCLRVWEEPCVEGSITLDEAKAIAEASPCMDDGNLTDDAPTYNNVTQTWWFDMDITKEGCAPACVVDEKTKTAEINWRCTGLIVPEENETVPEKYANATGCVGPSDVSYDILKKEEVWYQGTIHADTCTLATVVKQYYCKDGQVKDISEECPSGYDCRDGACKPIEYACSKTFGNDTTVKGHIVVAKGLNTIVDEYDECLDDGTIKEWVCSPAGQAEALELYCGTGMRCAEGEGRCVRSSCQETDAGDDPVHFGKITFKDKDDEYRDTCTEDDKLKEYYCYGNGIRSKNYRCVGDCVDDECVPVIE